MPDNNNVLFGAEFDNGNFTKGADAVIGKLREMKAANEDLVAQSETLKATNKALEASIQSLKESTIELKDSNKSYTQDIKLMEADLKKTTSEIAKLEKAMAAQDRTTSKGRAQYGLLKKELKELNLDYERGVKTIDSHTKIINDNTIRLKANEAEVKSHTATIKANADAIKANDFEAKKNNQTISETEKSMNKIGQAGEKSTIGIGKMYSGLRTLANILPGIGIAGLIGVIYEFGQKAVSALLDTEKALSDLQKRQAINTEIQTQANKTYSDGFAHLELIRAKLRDLSIPENERLKLLKEYNATADEGNKIDEKNINNLNIISISIGKQIQLIKERAFARASESVVADRAEKLFLAQEKARLEATEKRGKEEAAIAAGQVLVNNNKKGGGFFDAIENQARTRSKISQDVLAATKEEQADLDRALAAAFSFSTASGLTTTGVQNKGDKKEIENVFQQKLRELRARLATAQVAEFQSEPLIRNKFEEQLDKEFFEIGKLLKEKRLTGPQANILKGLLSQINEVELSKSLDEFRAKQKQALDRVNDAIQQAALEAGTKRVANIRDEFERDKANIEAAYTATLATLQKKLQELTKAVDEDVTKGLLSKKQGKEKKGLLALVFGDMVEQAEVAKQNAQLDLAFKTFQNTIKEAQRATDELLTQENEKEAERIGNLTKQYFAGTISYSKYQKELTKILREEANARRILRLGELREELDKINKELTATTDVGNRKKLEDQQRGVRNQISSLNQEIDKGGTQEDQDKKGKFLKTIVEYGNALNGLLSSVVSFWSQVNEVEQRSLDRSIALQQRRVDNAKDIADKGNAEYLEIEQKRMDELERKREENARKQIAINNALTLSQATVAAISAIAQAAATGSPIAAIGALAAVVGAIGAAFAFVNSLSPQSASFYSGTEYVSGDGRPRGKDTVPARLNIGERVVTTDKNQAYWDTLTAIHNGAVPPEALNSFVNQYPVPVVPSVDFGRLSEATNGKLSFDSYEISRELKTTNEKLDNVVQAVGAIGFHLNIDENGLAASVSKSIKFQNNLKKA